MDLYPDELRFPPKPVVGIVRGGVGSGECDVSILDGIKNHLKGPDRQPLFRFINYTLGEPLPARSFKNTPHHPSHSDGGVVVGKSSHHRRHSSNLGLSSSSSPRPELRPVPDGILRTNWMYKHLNVLPACVLLLFRMDVRDASEWPQREADISAALDKYRNMATGRNTKILLVLVQASSTPTLAASSSSSSSTTDGGTGTSSTLVSATTMHERISSLRRRANFDSKKSLVIYSLDDAESSSAALRKAMVESVTIYYRDIERRLKKDRRSYNPKATHTLLYVRYSFKMGFFCEFVKDRTHAIRYYSDAYKYVFDVYHRDRLRMAEVKIVADYLNFKLCLLKLETHHAQDATAQFHAHVQRVRPIIGMEEKEYEHWDYMSRQYRVFGDLLSAIPQSPGDGSRTAPLGHRQAGWYYLAAASNARKRRHVSRALCNPAIGTPELERYLDVEPTNRAGIDQGKQPYVGQYLVHCRSHPLEDGLQPSMPDEIDQLYRAVAIELKTDHSALILHLLNRAYVHYDAAKAKRSALHVGMLIAEELDRASSHSKALEYAHAIAISYREEGWNSLLKRALEIECRCARALGQAEAAVRCAFELLHPRVSPSRSERISWQQRLMYSIRLGENGDDDDGNDPAAKGKPASAADDAFPHMPSPLKVEQPDPQWPHYDDAPLIGCKCGFHHSKALLPAATAHHHRLDGDGRGQASVPLEDKKLRFYVVLRSKLPLPLLCTSLEVYFNKPSYDASYAESGVPLSPDETPHVVDGTQTFIIAPEGATVLALLIPARESCHALQCLGVRMVVSSNTEDEEYVPLLEFYWDMAALEQQNQDKHVLRVAAMGASAAGEASNGSVGAGGNSSSEESSPSTRLLVGKSAAFPHALQRMREKPHRKPKEECADSDEEREQQAQYSAALERYYDPPPSLSLPPDAVPLSADAYVKFGSGLAVGTEEEEMKEKHVEAEEDGKKRKKDGEESDIEGSKMRALHGVVQVEREGSRLEVELVHCPPALHNEFYRMDICLRNKDSHPATGSISLELLRRRGLADVGADSRRARSRSGVGHRSMGTLPSLMGAGEAHDGGGGATMSKTIPGAQGGEAPAAKRSTIRRPRSSTVPSSSSHGASGASASGSEGKGRAMGVEESGLSGSKTPPPVFFIVDERDGGARMMPATTLEFVDIAPYDGMEERVWKRSLYVRFPSTRGSASSSTTGIPGADDGASSSDDEGTVRQHTILIRTQYRTPMRGLTLGECKERVRLQRPFAIRFEYFNREHAPLQVPQTPSAPREEGSAETTGAPSSSNRSSGGGGRAASSKNPSSNGGGGAKTVLSHPLTKGEPFLLLTEVSCTTPYALTIRSAQLKALQDARTREPLMRHCPSASPFSPVRLSAGQRLSLWHRVTPLGAGAAVQMGALEIAWAREDDGTSSTTMTPAPSSSLDGRGTLLESLEPLRVISPPFAVHQSCPPNGVAGQPMELCMRIRNNTALLQPLVLSIREGGDFVFAGVRRQQFSLIPHGEREFKHVVVPLATGELSLPLASLVCTRYKHELLGENRRQFVFVEPSPLS